jgi:hypothetical protein
MGIGASALWALLRRQPLFLGGLGAAIMLNWVATMHFVPTLGRESNEARADISFVREAAAMLPTGSLVMSTDPCIWNVLGRNAGQFYSLENLVRTEMREMVRQYPGGIYLHWDYWVNCENRFAKPWSQLVLDTHATVFFRRNAEAVKFVLFRLDTPYALETMGGHYKPPHTKIDVDDVLSAMHAGRSESQAQESGAANPAGAQRAQTSR